MQTHKIGRLILIRHGESLWNITDKLSKRKTRFTGWADIPLSKQGIEQAVASGKCLSNLDVNYDAVFTSVLKRSRDSYDIISNEIKNSNKLIRYTASWRLNERHYGSLVGLSKSEAENSMGKEKVLGWRRSWEKCPPPMTKDPYFYYKQALSFSNDPKEQEDLFFDWSSEIWSKAITISRIPILKDEKLFYKEEKYIEENAIIPL